MISLWHSVFPAVDPNVDRVPDPLKGWERKFNTQDETGTTSLSHTHTSFEEIDVFDTSLFSDRKATGQSFCNNDFFKCSIGIVGV